MICKYLNSECKFDKWSDICNSCNQITPEEIKRQNMKKIVFITGAGISAESGISTYRDSDGLWENYNVEEVCTHDAWEKNPTLLTEFYNMLRVKYANVKPNNAHKVIAELEKDYDVTVITQNVDNLHEQAGSTKVIHLHGNGMVMCSSKDVEDESQHIHLPVDGWGESGIEVPVGTLAKDGSLLRPYIVFFGENVPNMIKSLPIVKNADIIVVVGTSLNVYPAASLASYANFESPMYIIDPKDVNTLEIPNSLRIHRIKDIASDGIYKLVEQLKSL